VAEARGRLERLGTEVRRLSEGAHDSEVSLAHRQNDLRHLEAIRSQILVQLETAERLGAGHEAVLQETADEAARLGRSLEAVRSRDRSEATAAEQLLGELGALQTERSVVQDAQVDLKVWVAEKRERAKAHTDQVVRLEAALEEARRSIAEVETETEQGRARAAQTAREVAEAEQNLLVLGKALHEERGRFAEAQRSGEEAAAEMTRLEADLKAVRARQQELRLGLGDVQLRAQETSLQAVHLAESIAERHGVDLEQAASGVEEAAQPDEGDEQKLESLKVSVARMGEINLTAIEECELIRQRHDNLTAQKADLERSVLQLRQAITRINRTSQRRFEETFALVNQRFGEIFPRLFMGGRGALLTTEPSGDSEECGVDIIAQPPGKRLQSMGLLSGGEKALTAVAFVFAIFLSKPTPFCLLDEVDAPLDEGNVGRFGDLVSELSRLSQFILITHNKKTMELADTLYGITMEEPGCSKLVSVRLGTRREPAAA
jgi:chromosome segregation protein